MELPSRPIIPGFHPDPTVCAVGEEFFLATSSFEYAPGVPLFRSRDLRDWQHIGHALDRPSQLTITGATPSGGVYAPTLRHHGDHFWLVTTNVTESFGQLLVTADDPAGPWSEPLRIPGAVGVDPDLAWDEDGTCYLTWSAFSGDGIVQAPLDVHTGQLLAPAHPLWQGMGGRHPEGPHLYQVEGLWYLLVAEGGTERGHAATVARAPSPQGPFEASPFNPLVTARSSDSLVQSTGHADLVRRPDGTWAIVYLGTRPGGWTPEFHVLGRETFASNVVWENGWPRLAAPIEPVAPRAFLEVLNGTNLPLSWVSPGRFPEEVLRREGGDWILDAVAADRTFVGRRQEHPRAVVHATVDTSSGGGGLELRIDPWHAVSLEIAHGTARAVAHVGQVHAVLGQAPVPTTAHVRLSVRRPTPGMVPPVQGPDEIAVAVLADGEWRELGRFDGRYVSTEVATGFTGRMVGMTATTGRVGFTGFSYLGADDDEALEAADAERRATDVAHA